MKWQWLTWLLVAISFVTAWSVPALVNLVKSFQHGSLKAQLLLLMLLGCATFLFFLLILLYSFPNRPRNCPVIHSYICLFTLLFVDAVMLTNMSTAWWVTPFSVWFGSGLGKKIGTRPEPRPPPGPDLLGSGSAWGLLGFGSGTGVLSNIN